MKFGPTEYPVGDFYDELVQSDGSVIQHFDIHNAGDDTWSAWFEERYVPK